MTSSLTTWSQYKSNWRVACYFLYRSRESKARKCRQLRVTLNQTQHQLRKCKKQMEQQQREIQQLKQQVRRLQTEKRIAAQNVTPVLPADPPIGSHGYGARMARLAVELAKAVGFRGAERSLQIVFQWLGVTDSTPHFTTIRTWMQRLGVAELQRPVEVADDWVWMVDHSTQIGPEKALVVRAIRAAQLPPPGTPLKHKDMRLLRLEPGTTWKTKDMATTYAQLAQRCGAPRAILCDGAPELRDGAECLKQKRSDTIVLNDFKHKCANFFKAMLAKDERFAEFTTLLGRTRSGIQQTELGHLVPPSMKQKARFMNLGAVLEWATMIIWLLDHPEAEARRLVSAERLEDKLGWLRSFVDDVSRWHESQQVIDRGLQFINTQGLFHGAAARLRALMEVDLVHPSSQQMVERLVGFVAGEEAKLKPGERLPLSTEILESSFGLYKQLERQHSKGGFTSLLAAFGALLCDSSTTMIRQAFAAVSVEDVKHWCQENLGATLTSKRNATYREYRNDQRRATKMPAVT